MKLRLAMARFHSFYCGKGWIHNFYFLVAAYPNNCIFVYAQQVSNIVYRTQLLKIVSYHSSVVFYQNRKNSGILNTFEL